MLHRLCAVLALAALIVVAVPAHAAETDLTATLKAETVTLKSSGPLAFGPQGILFIGDPAAATIYAIDTGDRTASESKDRPKVEDINGKIAALLGTETEDIKVKDLAANPISGTTYLAVARGQGPKATPVLVRVARDGKLSEVSLKDVKSAKASISNAKRQDAITHLAYVNGKVFVAGLSTEEFASTLRAIPFPFDKTDKGTGVKIFHGAHGRFETSSPVRVFAAYKIGDEDYLLAAYQCTPLVKLPVAKLTPGENVTGTTVAELGNRNRPLSMIVYKKDGKDYVLMANNSRGLMKIGLDGVDKIEGITAKIKDKAGLKYETIKGMAGVVKLDAFGKDYAVVLLESKEPKSKGKVTLTTIELP
jgi:hypothetical protein